MFEKTGKKCKLQMLGVSQSLRASFKSLKLEMKGSSRRHETFYCDRTNTAIRTTVDCSQPTTLAYNSTQIRYTNLPFAKRVSTDASFQMFILHRLLVTGRRPSRFSLEPFPPPPLEDDEKVVEESKPQKD